MTQQHWTITYRRIESFVRIGIYDFEHAPQRIWVDATVEGDFPLHPRGIEDCFNYQHLHRLVVEQWPLREHTALLETLVVEALEFVFEADSRVTRAQVAISKPDIFNEIESVSVSASWTRTEYEQKRSH